MHKKTHHIVTTPNPSDYIFAFENQAIYLLDGKRLPLFSEVENYFKNTKSFYCFAENNNNRCLIAEIDHIVGDEKFASVPLRSAHTILDEKLFALAWRARHLCHWRKTHAYCGVCGNKNNNKEDEQAMICSHCKYVTYPRISPCIIVLITRGEKILLARSSHFPSEVYSTLAGFVEPGESLAQTLHREIFEEVGLKVTNDVYFGSQPWPFPDSLMIGFTVEYLSGDIKIDPVEIEDAQWFDITNLPKLPQIGSIGRNLIEAYLSRQLSA